MIFPSFGILWDTTGNFGRRRGVEVVDMWMAQCLANEDVKSRLASICRRRATIRGGGPKINSTIVTLDTGADSGNYIGAGAIIGLELESLPVQHTARLGDGKAVLAVTRQVQLSISLERPNAIWTDCIYVDFFVVETMGNQAIIGLPTLMGSLYGYFFETIVSGGTFTSSEKLLVELIQLLDELRFQFKSPDPDFERCRVLLGDANVHGSDFRKIQDQIKSHLSSIEDVDVLDPGPGSLLPPWTKEDEPAPEELDTPEPLSFPENMFYYFKGSHQEALLEYRNEVLSRVEPEFLEACPQIKNLLFSEVAEQVFCPAEWLGIKMEPIQLSFKPGVPDRIIAPRRHIRPALMERAKAEFDRMRTYFYTSSNSSSSAALVIAPKGENAIRICADHRPQNQWLYIPNETIPDSREELQKVVGSCLTWICETPSTRCRWSCKLQSFFPYQLHGGSSAPSSCLKV